MVPQVPGIEVLPWIGEVTEMVGLLIASRGPVVSIGDFVEVRTSSGRSIRSQVIGFRNDRVLSMPLEETDGLQPGDRVIARSDDALLRVGPGLLGRVLDGFGRPMDDGPPVRAATAYPLYAAPPQPLDREHIVKPLVTGIRAIDGLLPCGKGQRVGIFGGSGVGKSTLLGAMSRHNDADVSVIALVGERNREVRAFLENELGPEGRSRSVVVVATSDRPAPLRIRACFVALAVAEYFRDQGKNVLLVVDSVTRLAMAQREIGLAAGEPPSQKGYTPSVFALLPKIFERSGHFKKGSITGLLHRFGGRRRLQRTHLRRGARHSGRAFHPLARAGGGRTLSGASISGSPLAGLRPKSRRRSSAAICRSCARRWRCITILRI